MTSIRTIALGALGTTALLSGAALLSLSAPLAPVAAETVPAPVVVTAPDGTVTVNQTQPDGSVVGSVTLPNGETFTFPAPAETVVPAPVVPAPVAAETVPAPAPAPAPVVPAPAETVVPVDRIEEDEPGWDCRTMGNRVCGVDIMGVWYLISFDHAGQPIMVNQR